MRDPAPGNGLLGLLFTDIEGSTRLWERDPAQMAVAQQLHDQILRSVVAAHDGWLIGSLGDSMRAAFPDPAHAAAAALDAQRRLETVDWGMPERLRVRIAIHLAPEAHGSLELNRLEAMLSLAHGGQILLTSSAAEWVRDALPPGDSLRDLGRWRLPDIGRAERVFQLTTPGLQAEFPPFAALTADRIALRREGDRFVGRRDELEHLHRLLDRPEVRLVTLTGPGGIGKTRLAQELIRAVQDGGGTSVSFVELVGLADPSRVMAAIASTLQVQEFGHAQTIDALVDALRDRELMIALDNFEHLLPAAEDVGTLLSRLPKLRLLITSRSPLRIRGEWLVPVGPLPVPVIPVGDWEPLVLTESMELFVDRADSAAPGFAVEAGNAGAIAQICRKLEGVPLAIELAAPLVRVLSMEELNARLDDRLSVTRDDLDDTDTRHRALRASIAWSYELIPPATQAFLRQLGVLQGGFTLETLEGLFGQDVDVLARIELLVEQNLVHQGGFRREADWFHLLESVRQFALEQLEAAGERERIQQRHASYFSGLLLDRFPDQRDFGAEAAHALTPLLDDLYQAILWTLETEPPRALALAAGAWRLWFIAGQLQAAEQWLALVLQRTSDLQTVDRVRAMYGQALMHYAKATAAGAIERSEASLALAESLGDLRGIGDACNYMGGMIAESTRDLARARGLIDRALDAYAACDDRHGWAETLLNRASLHYELGDYEASLVDGEALLAYCRSAQKDVLASNTLHGVAGIALMAGRVEQARVLLIEGFELSRRLGYDIFLVGNISVLGMLLNTLGLYEDALRLAEFGSVFLVEAPGATGIADPFRRNEQQRELQTQNLSPDVIARATEQGRRLTPSEAVDQALALLRASHPTP